MTARRRRPKTRLTAAERREALLDAATRLIKRTGVFRVTMAEVAAECGVAKPIAYDHFADADRLLAALVAREGERALAVLRDIIPDPAQLAGTSDRVTPLLARLELFFRAVQREPDVWRFTLLPPDGTAPAVRKRIEKEREVVRKRIVELLAWALPGGGAAYDLDLMSHGIHALVQRFAREIILEPDEYNAERVMAFIYALFQRPPSLRGA